MSTLSPESASRRPEVNSPPPALSVRESALSTTYTEPLPVTPPPERLIVSRPALPEAV